MPSSGNRFVPDQHRSIALRVYNTEVRSGIHQRQGKVTGDPGPRVGRPMPRLPYLGIADDHIHIAVVIEIEQTHAVVGTIGGAQRLASQQVLVQRSWASRKVRNFTFLPYFVAA